MQKIIKTFLLFFVFLFAGFSSAFSAQIKVEDVFGDINKNYKYYNELQTLYDRGMIFPDANGKFNAKKLLNRGEFVGISMEVTCRKCISPNTDFNLIKNYATAKSFYDVAKTNKYFYCIAEADDKGDVKGYDKGYTCENKQVQEDRRPFCVDNKITLEEALAVILRNSGIFTINDNKQVLEKIYNGSIVASLSDDIFPKKGDGGVYTFYGYFQKALDFELVEYDKKGNKKIYKLLEIENNKIRPHQYISKEDFLRIAYIALKTNSCIQKKIENDFSLKINVFPQECIKEKECTQKNKNIEGEDTFDFGVIVHGMCDKGDISDQQYIWKFYNEGTGKEIIKYGKYLDNFTFLTPGIWKIYLYVEDNCGFGSQVFSTIVIPDLDSYSTNKNNDIGKGGLSVSINTPTITDTSRMNIKFEGIVSGGVGGYQYLWELPNGTKLKNTAIPLHTFTSSGVYIVTLTVIDDNGNIGQASISVVVNQGNQGKSCEGDEDGDGIVDCGDKCLGLYGVIENEGCPILSTSCKGGNKDCNIGYFCDIKKGDIGVCIPQNYIFNSCLEQGQSALIYGNSICNSCPCSYNLDFNSTLRKCDSIFPAITSPASTKIYSRGNIYTIK